MRGSSWFPLTLGLIASCAQHSPVSWIQPATAQWQGAVARLDLLRSSVPTTPYVATIATMLRDPKSGRWIDARGAMAVAPGRAVRMILIGGAGATVLDAWVTRQQWRVAVPPLQIVRRGGADDPMGLPVGFLRWRFVLPFAGSAFAAATGPDGDRFLLRDGSTIVDLRLARCDEGHKRSITATRRAHGRVEEMDECEAMNSSPGSAAGDHVQYADETTGLRVKVDVESVGATGPTPEAFEDPDRDRGGT